MRDLRTGRNEHEGLTRISVRSSRDFYMVRNGWGEPVKVHRRGADLECECGQPECSHIASLRMCGFVEARHELPRAA
jgi:hypothetical protein